MSDLPEIPNGSNIEEMPYGGDPMSHFQEMVTINVNLSLLHHFLTYDIFFQQFVKKCNTLYSILLTTFYPIQVYKLKYLLLLDSRGKLPSPAKGPHLQRDGSDSWSKDIPHPGRYGVRLEGPSQYGSQTFWWKLHQETVSFHKGYSIPNIKPNRLGWSKM
jgi:hypothetical protein